MTISGLMRSFGKKSARVYQCDLFGIPGLRKSTDFPRIANDRVKAATVEMRQWCDRSTASDEPHHLVDRLDSVSNSLCQIADAAELIRNVESDQTWTDGATEAVKVVSQFMSEANVSTEYYLRACDIKERIEKSATRDPEHHRVISSMVEAMRNDGVALPQSEKDVLIELQAMDVHKSFEIIQDKQMITDEGVWIRLPTQSRHKNILPKRTHNGTEEYFIPADRPDIVSVLLKNTDCGLTRETIWCATSEVTDRVRRRETALHELLDTRKRLAKIRGYGTWNEYAQRESILAPHGGPRAVTSFLRELWIGIADGLEQERSALLSLVSGSEIQPWDVEYLTERWKLVNKDAISSSQMIQNELTLQRVLAGAQAVVNKVLGAHMEFDPTSGNLWSTEAFRLSLSRHDQRPFAYLYMDLYARPEKAVQSAQFTIAGSKLLSDGSRQTPQTAIVLSMPPNPAAPLPISSAQTVFHELGHAMHSLLSETNLQHFSGSRGAIDFVEFPSHLFEYFATDPKCLQSMVAGKLDDSFFEHYAENRNPFAYIEVAQQLMYALIDQACYATGETQDVWSYLPDGSRLKSDGLIQFLVPNSISNFEHLVHYGGSYYSYLLCRSIASDVWAKNFESDPFDESSGRRLVEFLKRGSVDQSLDSILSIFPEKPSSPAISTQSFLSELASCRAIHRR
jgi:intermediate peptidase